MKNSDSPPYRSSRSAMMRLANRLQWAFGRERKRVFRANPEQRTSLKVVRKSS